MNDDIAIKIDKVYKDFKLPHEKVNSVKGLFTKGFKKSKSSEVQHALKNISFEIKKGEFFGIVGRNGSGKSTLLKMIAGIYQPTKGSVTVAGKLVPFIELGVGFNPELTGRENVFLNGAILGFTVKQVEANYDKIVEFAELEEFMDQKLKNYSSGMQVRLAFACATMANADVLLVDEVLAVGDADFQRKCFNYFMSLKKKDTTVIFVTHDMFAVREYCDRVALINENHLVALGGPEEISEKYTKLFSDNVETVQTTSEERWGSGQVRFSNKPELKIQKDSILLNISVECVVDIDEPVFGFRIDNSAGEAVIGSNSKIANIKTKKLIKGDSLQLSWEIPQIFGDGDYAVTVSAHHTDGVTIYDWWTEVAKFKIVNPQTTPYLVSPQIKLDTKYSA